ncbi:MAG: hypothetical protein ABI693_26265 [Bryobacteraceae bacterium]
MKYLLPVLTVGLLAVPLGAATLERLSLDEMTARSTTIVRGKAVGTYTAASGRVIYTHFRIQVTEQWKGTSSPVLDIVVPGGASGGFRQSFSGAPSIKPNAEYVFFLWKSPSGLTHIIGLSQGLFSLKADTGGDLTALRTATTEPLLDNAGHLVQPEAMSLTLKSLRDRVQSVVAAGARQ